MNLQQLYYFRTIAELEHFTRAADKLMVTQPSLSHSINDLEAELGIHLFERQGRNIKLTKYGALFLEYVGESLDLLEEGKNKLRDYIDPTSGAVSLAYFSSLEEFVPHVIAHYYGETQHINVRFQFHQLPYSRIETMLLDGTADLAFSTQLDNDKLESHCIGQHHMVLIVPEDHPLAAQDSVDLSKLGGEKFITYDYQCKIRDHIDRIFEAVGIQPRIVSETTHDTLIFGSVAARFGIALIPQPLSMRYSNVKVLSIENEIPRREIHIIWKQVRYMSPVVKNFRDFIVKMDLALDDFRASLGIL